MKKSRLLVWLLVFVAFAAVGAIGRYVYDQTQPLTKKECRATMFAPVSAKEMGYRSMASLEADLRECGFPDREIAMWHAGDFATDYWQGVMPSYEEDDLTRYRLHLIYEDLEDIPSFFKAEEFSLSCQDHEGVELNFVMEAKDDGSWTMFSYNGGPDEWQMSCADVTK